MTDKQSGTTLRHALAAASLVLPALAMAQQQTDGLVTVTRLTPAQAAKVAAMKETIKAAAAQRAAVDETGKLRPHEHDDAPADALAKTADTAKRNSATAAMSAQTTGKVVNHTNGAVGQRFNPEFLNFARASVNKQGQLEADCTEASHEGHTHAEKGAK